MEDILTPQELAERWLVNVRTIYSSIDKLPHFRIGNKIRFQLNLIKAYEKGEEICQEKNLNLPLALKDGLSLSERQKTGITSMPAQKEKQVKSAYIRQILNKQN